MGLAEISGTTEPQCSLCPVLLSLSPPLPVLIPINIQHAKPRLRQFPRDLAPSLGWIQGSSSGGGQGGVVEDVCWRYSYGLNVSCKGKRNQGCFLGLGSKQVVLMLFSDSLGEKHWPQKFWRVPK